MLTATQILKAVQSEQQKEKRRSEKKHNECLCAARGVFLLPVINFDTLPLEFVMNNSISLSEEQCHVQPMIADTGKTKYMVYHCSYEEFKAAMVEVMEEINLQDDQNEFILVKNNFNVLKVDIRPKAKERTPLAAMVNWEHPG